MSVCVHPPVLANLLQQHSASSTTGQQSCVLVGFVTPAGVAVVLSCIGPVTSQHDLPVEMIIPAGLSVVGRSFAVPEGSDDAVAASLRTSVQPTFPASWFPHFQHLQMNQDADNSRSLLVVASVAPNATKPRLWRVSGEVGSPWVIFRTPVSLFFSFLSPLLLLFLLFFASPMLILCCLFFPVSSVDYFRVATA